MQLHFDLGTNSVVYKQSCIIVFFDKLNTVIVQKNITGFLLFLAFTHFSAQLQYCDVVLPVGRNEVPMAEDSLHVVTNSFARWIMQIVLARGDFNVTWLLVKSTRREGC